MTSPLLKLQQQQPPSNNNNQELQQQEFDITTYLNMDEHGNAVGQQDDADDIRKPSSAAKVTNGHNQQTNAERTSAEIAEEEKVRAVDTVIGAVDNEIREVVNTVVEQSRQEREMSSEQEEESVVEALRLSTEQQKLAERRRRSSVATGGDRELKRLDTVGSEVVLTPGRRRLTGKSLSFNTQMDDDGNEQSNQPSKLVGQVEEIKLKVATPLKKSATPVKKEPTPKKKPAVKFAAWWLKPITMVSWLCITGFIDYIGKWKDRGRG
jgi:hypothetical protein